MTQRRSQYFLPAALLLAALGLSACADGPSDTPVASLPPPPAPAPAPAPKVEPNFLQEGYASWYGDRFKHRPTASGERFDPRAMTAAHRWLPLETIARITNLSNGREITVRINDRGPFVGDRIIDLSRGAAAELGMKAEGVARVRIEVWGADQARTVASYAVINP